MTKVAISDVDVIRPHLYTVVKQYCEDDASTNGLFLIDMPTGFGKTHSVLDFIYEAALSDQFSNRKIFFITSLKKNLPSSELEERFVKAGKTQVFKEKFLFLDSNADCVISNLTSEVIKTIPVEIKATDEYKALVQDVQFLQSQQGRQNEALKGFAPSIRENLRKTSEPNFRRYIERLLAKQFRNAKDRLYAIKTDSKWQWLGRVYPAVFTRDRQIIFMSVDKFLSQNATIIEPSTMIYNSPIVKDALIFIDEFDAAKDTILKNIIQNGLRDKVDYLNLFREIYASLQTSQFPRKLTTPSRQRQDGQYKDQSLQSVIDKIKEMAEDIYQEYSLQFSHKTTDEVLDTSRNFLFQDHQFHSILDADRSYIVIRSDPSQQINTIRFSNTKPDTKKNNIQFLLSNLYGFIKYFQGTVNILAINYMQCKQEQRKDGDDDFTLESAIRSVLTEFSLSDFHKDYITSQILISSHRSSGKIEGSEYDLKFYENGFRYYAFIDEPSHDMRSSIMMYGFQTTPEKVLLRFCEKAKVIGISATATIPSVIGNFDIEYLKSKLQKNFVELSAFDRNRLTEEFNNASAGYDKVEIAAHLISGKPNGDYSRNSWFQVYDNEELVEAVFNEIEQELSADANNYNKERYLRIATAYKEFITHRDIQSFLCVLTKHPRKGDRYLNLDVLIKLFQYIHQERGITESPSNMVFQLDGEEYDSKKEWIQKRLEKGDKIFIISVYQTIGAGQNLQYKIPKSLAGEIVSTNSFSSRGEKDIDAIYLDKPTNVLVQLTDNLEEEAFVKYLFQTEFLQEAAEISSKDAFSHIKKAFVTFYTGLAQRNMWAPDVYKSRSAMMLSTRTIIQAIGRICRTNQKRRHIYVFADERLSESVDMTILRDRMFNREFLALTGKLKECPPVDISVRNMEDAASLLSVRVNKHINNFLNETWTEERISHWQALRELVLRHPTMSAGEVKESFIASNFYVEMPCSGNKIWYAQDNDYNNIQVGFTNITAYPFEVSESAARLDMLMANATLRELFVSNGYATSFQENEFIMSPALFNNIYKGALGEVIGKAILTQHLQIPLDDIREPELYELFDFVVPGTSIYVDFKHWEESTQFNARDMLDKISSKAKKCGAECVIVINILASKRYPVKDTVVEGIRIIEVPALLFIGQNGQYMRGDWEKLREVVNEFSN